jgi:hypothetical protein
MGAIFFLLSFAAFMKSDVANTDVQNLQIPITFLKNAFLFPSHP